MLTHYQFNSNTQARGSEHRGNYTHGGKKLEIVGRKSVPTAYGFKRLGTTVLRIVCIVNRHSTRM